MLHGGKRHCACPVQEAVLAGLDPLQLQPQPIDDCLATLGCMLAGGQFTPPVMGSHASMVEKERKKDADVKARPDYDS